MNLLYLSCHSILEYDELRIFNELGIDVFSHGAYHNPQNLDDKKRPPLDLPYHKQFSDNTLLYPKENLDPELMKWADTVICMHVSDWLMRNWTTLRKKRVILRTIGQSTIEDESLLRWLRRDGLEIVRYSPRERTIPGFVGEDAMIRFAKKPEEFGPWNGQKMQVITVGQSMRQRDFSCNWNIFEKATLDYPRKVFGPHNEDLGDTYGGCPDYAGLREEMASAFQYFYTGTYPASYTLNFIEAAMTGLPMVALGDYLGNGPDFQAQQTYEVAELLQKYDAGMTGNTIVELRAAVDSLFAQPDLRKKFSKNIRSMALDLFSHEKIKAQWKDYLKI
jgi:hypothetical protein